MGIYIVFVTFIACMYMYLETTIYLNIYLHFKPKFHAYKETYHDIFRYGWCFTHWSKPIIIYCMPVLLHAGCCAGGSCGARRDHNGDAAGLAWRDWARLWGFMCWYAYYGAEGLPYIYTFLYMGSYIVYMDVHVKAYLPLELNPGMTGFRRSASSIGAECGFPWPFAG